MRVYNLNLNKRIAAAAADSNISYLAHEEEVLEDGSVHFHHHDVLMSVSIEELFCFHLAGLNNHDHLSLYLVERWSLGHELNIIGGDLVDEDEHLVKVAPELLQNVPITQTVDG